MRKSYTLALILITTLLANNAIAYDFSAVCSTGQTLYYNITSYVEPYTVEVTSENTEEPYYTTYPEGELVIPETVEYNSITYSVTSIGAFAFYNCNGLTEITIPAPITSIGELAFAYCTGLIVVNFNAENCTLMENTNNYVFDDSALVTVNIGDNVKNIPDYAFNWCYYLETITIGRSVKSIGNHAFGNCRRLSVVNYNAINCTSISSYAFSSSYFTTLNIDDEVINIPANAFYQCYGIFSITIPNSVESIGDLAFYCVKNIIYNGSATGSPWGALTFDGYIEGDFVYEDDTKVNLTGCNISATSVEIPNSVTSIGDYAFSQCSGLTSITIPENVTSIGNLAFTGCTGLTDPIYNGTCFAYLPKGYTGEYAIPEGIQKIAGCACRVCNSLTEITIPNSVVSIGFLAFSSCNALTTVNYNATNATIEDSSSPFSGSSALTTINIGENVKNIPAYTFEGCEGLTEITIPDSVTSIGQSAFYDCSGLTTITSLATNPPTIGSLTFSSVNSNIPVYVPCLSVSAYNATQYWGSFTNIQGDPTTNFTLIVQSQNETMGSVTGGGENFSCETETTITATPNEGYRFLQWNDGNTDNPRTVVVTTDSTFTAGFRAIYTVTVQSNNEAYGTVSGGGTYDEGSTATISATPYQGYRFVQWNDGNYDNPRTITVTSHITYEAVFEGTNDLGVVSINSPVSGCGLSSENIRITIKNYGVFQQSYIVKYSVDGGINWTEETVNSSIDAGVTTDYTFNATLDMSAVGTYNIIAKTALVGDEDASNDEAERIVVSQGLYDSSNSYTDFNDADEDDFVNDWYTDGTNSSWAFGKTAVSQNDSIWTWATNPNGLVNPDEESFLYSPCYDLSGMENPIIKIKLNYNLNAMDIGSVGAYLSLYWSHDGSPAWSLIEPGDVNEGWYPPGLASDTTTPGWSGNTNGFVTVRTNLLMPTSIDRTNIKFRFAFVTDNVNSGENEEIFINGAAINSFVIYDCPSIPSASFTTSEPLCTGQPIQFTNNSQNAESSAWNFGDGTGIDLGETIGEEGFDFSQFFGDGSTTSTDENPTMTYQTAGEYGVTLVVTNECGSSSHWESLIVNSCTNTYTITVLSNNDAYGMVSGGGTYEEGSTATISATPYQGYRFVSWNDGSTDNPRIITVTSDSTFMANFEANIYTITVLSNNDAYGMVSGGGTYEEGSSVVISAMPYEGYRFVQWNDGNTDDMRTITVTSDSTFVANFEAEQAQQYTITVLSSNEAYGSVLGGGTYYDGDTVAILAIPNSGYNFVSWNDGYESSPRTIVVTSDSTFIADFVKCEITYAIDTVVNNFVTVGDHTFYSTGNYSFAVLHETACDTIFDIRLRVLAEPVYDIGPNPTKSFLNINSDGFVSAVEFYSVTGQLVMRKEVNGYEAEFDVEGLEDGVYILRIYGEETSLPSVYKVVKE